MGQPLENPPFAKVMPQLRHVGRIAAIQPSAELSDWQTAGVLDGLSVNVPASTRQFCMRTTSGRATAKTRARFVFASDGAQHSTNPATKAAAVGSTCAALA